MEEIPKYGQSSNMVFAYQGLLNQFGYPIAVDGQYGDGTKMVVGKHQAHHKQKVTGNMDMAILSKLHDDTGNTAVILLPLPAHQIIQEKHPKTQIVIHHTASGRGVDGDFMHWLNTPERICTAEIIDWKGQVYQTMNPMYWGHHIGMNHKNNKVRNQQSVAYELDSWGPLAKVGRRFYAYTGKEVHVSQVYSFMQPYRVYPKSDFFSKYGLVGKPCQYYEVYPTEQIEALVKRIKVHAKMFNIPLVYHDDMWDVSEAAINGEPGIWCHGSYRQDKTDAVPQKGLVNALKQLCV